MPFVCRCVCRCIKKNVDRPTSCLRTQAAAYTSSVTESRSQTAASLTGKGYGRFHISPRFQRSVSRVMRIFTSRYLRSRYPSPHTAENDLYFPGDVRCKFTRHRMHIDIYRYAYFTGRSGSKGNALSRTEGGVTNTWARNRYTGRLCVLRRARVSFADFSRDFLSEQNILKVRMSICVPGNPLHTRYFHGYAKEYSIRTVLG